MSLTVLNVSKNNLIPECHKRLNKIGKMTLKNVAQANEDTCDFLRNATPARLKELAMMNCFAADKIKQELDKVYGENNYVLVTIGRSISSIVETMDKLGVEAKIIPLSGLRRGEIDSVPKEDLNIYKTFLVQVGLSKTDLERNKNKTYILMDYTYYGRSLKKAEQLLKKDEILGDVKNLISMPVSEVLGRDYEERGFKKLFEYCRFKNFAFVGKLHIDDLKDVYNQCSPERVAEYRGNVNDGIRKLFWFNVFDSLLKNNYSDIFPRKEFSALYAHHLSPKAIQNYLRREIKKESNIVDDFKKQN